jgi:hypothetical protein
VVVSDAAGARSRSVSFFGLSTLVGGDHGNAAPVGVVPRWLLLGGVSAVDRECDAGDVGRCVATTLQFVVRI